MHCFTLWIRDMGNEERGQDQDGGNVAWNDKISNEEVLKRIMRI